MKKNGIANDISIAEEEIPAGRLGRRGWCEPDSRIYTPWKAEGGKSVKAAGEKTVLAADGKRETIPLFFATDNNYLPFLSVTLQSVKENSSKNFIYKIYI